VPGTTRDVLVARHRIDHFGKAGLMKFMVVSRITPDRYRTAVETFLEAYRQERASSSSEAETSGWPTTVSGPWHVPGSTLVWHLVDGDPTEVAKQVATGVGIWGLEVEVYPVIDNDEAAAVLTTMFGE
jgi:hypothetical protein